MIYMLDTNILIYLIKNKPPSVAARINALDSRTKLSMSFLTYAELLKGAERSTRRAQVLDQLQQLTRIIPVNYTANAELCQHYATQFTRLKIAGTSIGVVEDSMLFQCFFHCKCSNKICHVFWLFNYFRLFRNYI